MALFGNLSEKLSHAFSKITNRGKLTELEIKQAMREIRIALLEADVNFLVVKKLVSEITEEAMGERVMKSLTPGQQIVKIVNEHLTKLMGSTQSKLQVSSKLPTVILMCGLQGAGKTTMSAKLAKMLKKQGKKPLLVACDIYRPAAINQLQVVGNQVGVEVFEKGTQTPAKTAKQAVEYANKKGYDTVIVDTAGRLHIDEALMQELLQVKQAVAPTEILLTVDAMTGQDAVNVAKSFDEELDLSGVILTKLDGDTRGGAALSIKAITGKPIKFIGTGEKMDDLEAFYPDRMASRILDMGDVLTLIEKAQETVDMEQAQQQMKKLKENSFTFEDYLVQMDQLKNLGGLTNLMGMIPGMGKLKIDPSQMDESKLLRQKAIIQSMTPKERRHPEIMKGSRKKRIAVGSGTTIQEVNMLLKQFEQSKQLMKQMAGGKGRFKLPF